MQKFKSVLFFVLATVWMLVSSIREVQAQGQTLIFSAIADVPYSSSENTTLQTHVNNHNTYSPSEFMLHLGDIKSGGGSCPASFYQTLANILKTSQVPVFIVPGDNEWTDCSNQTQAWSYWTQYLMNFEDNFCGSPAAERQSVRPENVAFVVKGVLFIGINLVSGTESGWATRLQQDADWVTDKFNQYGSQVRTVVVFAHAGPSSSRKIFFDPFRAAAKAFAKPVLYIHGNDHSWKQDFPWPEKNIMRVVLDRGNKPPVKVTVSTDPLNMFSFDRDPFGGNPQPYNRPPCGSPSPVITVTPSSYNYGAVEVGSSASKTFVVANSGSATLDVSDVTLTTGNNTEFSIVSGGGAFSLAPGASQNVVVDFLPASTGAKSTKLRFESNVPNNSSYDVTLSGTGVFSVPDITVTPASHNYGQVVVGSSAMKTFKVENSGSVQLDVSSVSIAGTDASEFGIVSGGGAFSLVGGASRDVTVSFNPAATGAKSAALSFVSNDPDENPLDVPLTGTGVDNPPSGSTVTFEEAKTGGSIGVSSVTTSGSLTAVNDHLYLAAISMKSFVSVSTVSGLGLTWTRVRSQCAGRNQTGVEVWMAQGSPSASGTVTAALSGPPKTAVILVCRYSGADAANPIGAMVSGNTTGTSGSCSGGSDNSSYSFNLTTTVSGSVVYGAAGMRNKTHTPGAGYTERAEFILGSSSDGAGLAVEDKTVASPSTVAVDGSFSSTVDWAVIAIEIKPPSALAKLTANSEAEIVAEERIPTRYEVFHAYPNPFNAETTIEYTLPEETHVHVHIYNIRGERVITLVDGHEAAGVKRVRWDGRDEFGGEASSGVYFVRLETEQHIFTQRVFLQK